MSESKEVVLEDKLKLDDEVSRLSNVALGVGVAGIVGGIVVGMGDRTLLMQSYLIGFMYVLALGLGSLWFVAIQHLTNAHWSVVVRRVAEILAANLDIIGFLALGMIIPMATGDESMQAIYRWLDHDLVHKDHLLHHKAGYLNVPFFLVRCAIYFGFWIFISRFFLNKSVAQDQSGDAGLTTKMATASAPGMILFGLTLTFCAFDFLMSIDYVFFSTIFGVYYFAGCIKSAYSILALSLMWVQAKGALKSSVNQEHYHDLGKMMFAFTVFWAYIGFSQFMLIWYADIPEETHWFHWRFEGDWRWVSLTLLICNFAIPFFGLLSRHVKRNRMGLAFWACWLLVMEAVDLYWLVFPNGSPDAPSPVPVILFVVGMLGVFIGVAARRAKGLNLLPTKDPRLAKSLAFQNV